MQTFSKSKLFEVLIFALIAQTFAGILPPAQIWRRLSRRAIDGAAESAKTAANDRDIASMVAATANDQSDDQISLKLKSIQGVVANANTADTADESEISRAVKSTKLLPALGNSHASAGEPKSSAKLMLNRVESHEVESANGYETKEIVEETKENATMHNDSEEISSKQLDAGKFGGESQDVSTTTTRMASVYNQANETLEKTLAKDTSKSHHVSNGLDEVVLQFNDGKSKSLESVEIKDEQQPATTESILKDVENIALKITKPITDRTLLPTDERTEDARSKVLTETEIGHNAGSLEEAGESLGRSMDAVHSSENKLEVAFGEKTLADEKINTTTVMKFAAKSDVSTEKWESTTTVGEPDKHSLNQNETNIAEQQLQDKQKIEVDLQHSQSNESTTFHSKPHTTTTPKGVTDIQAEIQLSSHISHITAAEKRGKFISGNSTNSRNMNLPDGPEVWSLAGMRTVPKVTHQNGTSMLANDNNGGAYPNWQLNEIVTTERALNVSSYSEKNLLDWTKVMGMRGVLEPADAMEKNHLTESALENDGDIESVKGSKTALPMLMADKFETEGPSKVIDVTTPHQTTKASAPTSVSEKPTATHVMNEIDIMQMITNLSEITALPTMVTTTAQTTVSSDSPLSVDDNTKFRITAVAVADVGESLNKSSSAYTESSTPQKSAEKTDVGNFNAAMESSTERQPSDDFNFIVTSTTPMALLEISDAAIAVSILNDTTTVATMPTAFPLGQSTSTTPSPSDGAEAPKHWQNATTLETQHETTQITLLKNVDAGVNNTTRVDMSSSNYGVHDVTIEQHSKREPETVTETEIEAQTTLLTVSELPSSEAHGLASAAERKTDVNVNTNASGSGSVVTGEGISTQNETPNVVTETTTESSQIATTTAIAFINTTVLSTDLVDTNVSANISVVPTVTVTEIATTTEVSQIGNEVELEIRTAHITATADEQTDSATATATLNNDTGSRTVEVLDKTTAATTTATTYEPSTTAKTVSSINELLMLVNVTTTTTTATTTSTTAVPITTPLTQFTVEPVLYETTTLKSDESVNEDTTTTIIPLEAITVRPTGSVFDNNTSTANTAPTPVDFQNHTAVAADTHDKESAIETNVIDQLDNTTVKISDTSTTKTTTSTMTITEVGVAEPEIVTASNVSNETVLPGLQDAEKGIVATTTTTMASVLLSSTDSTPATLSAAVHNSSLDTTTTEPPLINLLDDLTTPRTTSPISTSSQPPETTSSIGVKPQEVFAVFSTTESTSTAAIPPLVPILPTTSNTASPVDSAASAHIPTVASTIATVTTTTILPPTLQASIGGTSSGGAGGGEMPTHLPGMINAGMRPNSSDANETDVNVIIAITVSIIGVVALILLVAFLYLMRKRQKQMSYGQRCRPVSLDAYSLDNVSVLGSVRRKGALRASKRSYGNIAFDDPSLRHNALSASELSKFVERRSSIFEEFRDVPQIITRADEVPPGCEDKNRYANVIPLPETRVVLQQLGDDDKTEYINANYVRGPKDAPNYYIATQAPLETTVTDFWRMIWEQQSRVIIQATDLYENGIEKCAEYLPPSVTLDNHTTYGDFQITLKHREVKDKYAISTLMLKNTAEGVSRELTHYWYKWPEAGVPNEEAPIIAMLLEARSSLKGYVNEAREKSSSATLKADADGEVTANGNGVAVISMEDGTQKMELERVNGLGGRDNGGSAEINGNVSTTADKVKGTTLRNQGPLTIHCSPGTGRTGTIIACDMAIRSLETPKRSVDIPQIVYYVRRGRASAVQTKEQYEFIYKVAHMYATKITNLSNDN